MENHIYKCEFQGDNWESITINYYQDNRKSELGPAEQDLPLRKKIITHVY